MSVQFEPKEILGRGSESYDSNAYLLKVFLKEENPKNAEACEAKLKFLDQEWANQGEP